jgi:leader peptidase (prepilin peptidase)/N-methyltransferase
MLFTEGHSSLFAVVVAATLGGVLGWWPIASWALRNMIPAVASASASSSDALRPDQGSEPAPETESGAVSEPDSGAAAESAPVMAAAPGTRAAPGEGSSPSRSSARSPASVSTPSWTVRAVRPAAGAMVAAAWALAAWRLGPDPALPGVLAFAAAGAALTIVDVADHRLPNRVLGPAFVIVAILLGVAAMMSGDWLALLRAALGAAAMFAGYLLVALVSPTAMGMGDVKLAALIGLLLGWFGLDAWLIGLAAAFVLGGVVAIAALGMRRVTLRGALPFGPSMLAGALLAVFVVA